MEYFLRQYWNDPRLTFTPISGVDKVVVSSDNVPIWQPDTFIVNEKMTGSNAPIKNQFLRIESTGDILLSKRMTTVLHCNMCFKNFPWDTQTCPLTLESCKISTLIFNVMTPSDDIFFQIPLENPSWNTSGEE